jgi:hypothetical protein
MKKFAFILGIVIVAGVIFVGGLVLGTQHDFMNTIISSLSLGDDISKASTTLVVLRQLEAGEIDKAKAFLNLQLDGAIIGMDVILPHCPDGDGTRAAQTLLVGIAEHRTKYPAKANETIDQKVREILKTTGKQNN